MPRHLRQRAQLTGLSERSPSLSPPISRPPRPAAARRSEELTSITVEQSKASEQYTEPQPTTTVTLKMPTNKLRAVSTKGVLDSRASYGSAASQRAPRSTRSKRSLVIDSDSDDDGDDLNDEDVEMDDEDDEDDAEGEDEDMGLDPDEDAEGDDDDNEDDVEGEDDNDDAEGEEDVEVAPPAARRQAAAAAAASGSKPTVTVTPAPIARVQSVESKEMRLASSATTDDELSELPSEGMGSAGEDGDDDDEEMGEDDDLGAEGETDEEGMDMATPGSRDSTPDVTKMTKRQRGRLDQVMGNDFLQLPMEPQIKKHLTAEEHAMRRAEMARRRKNLSEKRNEEEKMDTINRLLKKQAPKRRGKISQAEIAAGAGAADTPDPTGSAAEERDYGPDPADPVFARWVSRKSGNLLGLPYEWKGVDGVSAWSGNATWKDVKMVEEVEG